MSDGLLFFFGTECHICHEVEPMLDRLADELGVEITKLEVWHNSENKKLLLETDKINCKGVPFFFNEKSGKGLCGRKTEEEYRKWMQGE